MTPITFKPLTLENANSVQAIMTEGGGPGLPQWSVMNVRTTLAQAPVVSWGAFSERGLHAFLLAQGSGGGVVEILHLATATAMRGQGFMRGLMTQWLAALPARTEVWLEVHEANNAARQLYQSCGFRETGRRAKYYADGGAAVLYNLG